jgi:hypothetical protein
LLLSACVLSAVAFAGGGFSQPVVAAEVGDEAIDEILPELPASDDIAAIPLAEGEVRDPASGEPQDGAVVTLEAWPTAEEIGQLQVGDTVPVVTIAKDETDADGSYELKVDDQDLIAPYLSDNGDVQLEVVVHTEYGDQAMGATVSVDLTESGDVVPIGNTADGAGTATIDLSADSVLSAAELLAEETGERPRSLESGWSVAKDLGLRNVQFEHVASTKAGVSAKVYHEKSRTATVGYGASTTGAASGYKVSGTQSITIGTTNDFAKETGSFSSKYFFQEKYVVLRKYVIGDGTGWKPVAQNQWKVQPSGTTTGGFATKNHPVPSATACGTYSAGSHVFSTKQATTFSAGVSLAGAVGIDFSSKSGRTTGQKVTFSYGGSGVFKICGVNNYPGNDNTGALVAK